MKLAAPSSFDLRSDHAAAAGCITGVIRRILCRSLQVRSYRDEDKEVGKIIERRPTKNGKSVVAAAPRASPGIVARLMGLEKSAAIPFAQSEMISRTRSANSAETSKGAGILSEQTSSDGCSQLRKSQSLHEVPSYLRKESEEFLVLTFGHFDDGEASELGSKKSDFCVEMYNMSESRAGGEMTDKKRLGNKMWTNDAKSNHWDTTKGFVSSLTEKAMELNEMAVSRKKLYFAQGEMETECSSQNSSPVSVFDLPLQLDTECLIPDSSFSVESQKILSEIEKERKKKGISVPVAHDLPDIWELTCKLGEEDLIKENWIMKKMSKYEEAEELGHVIGHGILDILLHEAVLDMRNL